VGAAVVEIELRGGRQILRDEQPRRSRGGTGASSHGSSAGRVQTQERAMATTKQRTAAKRNVRKA
jgi:hypothetical protein